MEGNQMKIREALEEILLVCYKAGARRYRYDVACGIIKAMARKALSLPLRNCDVGTAEEQCARWRKFCDGHSERISETSFVCNCPCKGCGIGECEIAWAQMPYEEEGRAKK